MSIKKFFHTHQKAVTVTVGVLVGIPAFFIILGLFKMFLFGGVHTLSTLSDSFSPMASKSARYNSFSHEQAADFEEGIGASSGGDWNDSATFTQEDKKVIKTASLSLVVEDVEIAVANIKGIAESLGGSADNRNIYESGNNRKYGTVTVRVPNGNFDVALQSIKKDARKVTNESVNSKDVTEEYVDLAAQLKNLRSVESQYVEVLEKAETIDDILKVRNVLDRTRNEIERLQGKMLYLERQVSMSTITVSLVSEADVEVMGVIWNPLIKIKQAALRTLESLIQFVYTMINLAFVIPILVLWVGIFVGFIYTAWKGGWWLKGRLLGKCCGRKKR